MNATVRSWSFALGLVSLVAGCAAPPASPPQSSSSESSTAAIEIDGSSTVFPITDEVAKRYQFENTDAPTINVSFSGTGGGFRKFCAGETQISNASRPISSEEMAACKAEGIQYIELPVAFDALTVVVNGENQWAEDITVEELEKLWEPTAEGEITRWNQIRSSWPDEPIELYGPGEDSGTFDYFTEVVMGKSGASRSDYTDSEDDTVLVEGVRKDVNALGYFGYAYYQENQKTLNALAIDSGNGPVLPSDEAVRNAEYQPFSRPLFIYVNAKAVQERPELQAFVQYYLNNARHLVQVVGYEPLPDEAYSLVLDYFDQGRHGTVFAGQAQPNLTIEELLQKEAAF